MMLIVALSLAVFTSQATASGHLRSTSNLQPEQVAGTLMNVQNEWKAQAHVVAQCGAKGNDKLPICKEAPEAFHHSCVKVVSTVMLASGGSVDDSSEYMANVCSQKILSQWHQSKCNAVGSAIINQMSGNPAENRESYFAHAEGACTGLWTNFVEEQEKIRDTEAEEEKKEAAEAAVEDTRAAEDARRHAFEAKVKKAAQAHLEADKRAWQSGHAPISPQVHRSKEEKKVHIESSLEPVKAPAKDAAKKDHDKANAKKEELEIVIASSAPKAPAASAVAKESAAVPEAAPKKKGSIALLQVSAPADELAKEMTHDLELNFNKIAPFGKEDTAKELQDHASKTQDTLVDAVENAEVAEIKRAVFRALTRLRAATIKEFDTIARLETQAIDAYNDAHHFRAENPLAHLHEDEAPVSTDKLKSFH